MNILAANLPLPVDSTALDSGTVDPLSERPNPAVPAPEQPAEADPTAVPHTVTGAETNEADERAGADPQLPPARLSTPTELPHTVTGAETNEPDERAGADPQLPPVRPRTPTELPHTATGAETTVAVGWAAGRVTVTFTGTGATDLRDGAEPAEAAGTETAGAAKRVRAAAMEGADATVGAAAMEGADATVGAVRVTLIGFPDALTGTEISGFGRACECARVGPAFGLPSTETEFPVAVTGAATT